MPTLTTNNVTKKSIVDLEIVKNGHNLELHIKAVPEIEDFFRKSAEDITRQAGGGDTLQTSSKWFTPDGQGLRFYMKTPSMAQFSNGASVIDDFGSSLIRDGRINVGLLRAVGVSQGDGIVIRTTDLLAFEEMKRYAESLGAFVKQFYIETLRENSVKASITFEV